MTVQCIKEGTLPNNVKAEANEKLLDILIRDPAFVGCLGIQTQPFQEKKEATQLKIENAAHLLGAIPPHFSTIEDFNDVCSNTRKKFLYSVTAAVLLELFLLAVTISPFHTGGAFKAIAQAISNANNPWRATIIINTLYMIFLLGVSTKTYLSRTSYSEEWKHVYHAALAGMILELLFTLLVKKLNIISFAVRGLIAFFANSLANILPNKENASTEAIL